LTCRDEVGAPASYFSSEVDKIWWELATDLGIDSYTYCQIQEHRSNLAESWYKGSLDTAASEEDQDEEEEEEWNNDTDSDKPEGDDDMPDLTHLADHIPESIETVD
jgi:hypothetical protein